MKELEYKEDYHFATSDFDQALLYLVSAYTDPDEPLSGKDTWLCFDASECEGFFYTTDLVCSAEEVILSKSDFIKEVQRMLPPVIKSAIKTPSIKEQVLAFNKVSTLQKVTTNGEICWCRSGQIFVVFDETYAYEVGRTKYPLVAVAMLESYCEEYLEGEEIED